MEPNVPQKKSYVLPVVIVILILGVALYAISKYSKNTETDDSIRTLPQAGLPAPTVATTTPVATTTTEVKKDVPITYVYKDGTYSTTGEYDSPAGTEQMGVSVTIKNDMIVGSTVTAKAGDGTSMRYQKVFIANYAQYVTGKKIADLKLGKVSGASLTPVGFNNALEKIKAQAKA